MRRRTCDMGEDCRLIRARTQLSLPTICAVCQPRDSQSGLPRALTGALNIVSCFGFLAPVRAFAESAALSQAALAAISWPPFEPVPKRRGPMHCRGCKNQ